MLSSREPVYRRGSRSSQLSHWCRLPRLQAATDGEQRNLELKREKRSGYSVILESAITGGSINTNKDVHFILDTYFLSDNRQTDKVTIAFIILVKPDIDDRLCMCSFSCTSMHKRV